jgi:hypothetical protein
MRIRALAAGALVSIAFVVAIPAASAQKILTQPGDFALGVGQEKDITWGHEDGLTCSAASSDTAVATVATGWGYALQHGKNFFVVKVTGVKFGSATITATCSPQTGTAVTDSVLVLVAATPGDGTVEQSLAIGDVEGKVADIAFENIPLVIKVLGYVFGVFLAIMLIRFIVRRVSGSFGQLGSGR